MPGLDVADVVDVVDVVDFVTVNSVSAEPVVETMLNVCLPTLSVFTNSFFKVTIMLPSLRV